MCVSGKWQFIFTANALKKSLMQFKVEEKCLKGNAKK